MKKNWKKTVAFVLSLAIVAGPMTANVGIFNNESGIVHAEIDYAAHIDLRNTDIIVDLENKTFTVYDKDSGAIIDPEAYDYTYYNYEGYLSPEYPTEPGKYGIIIGPAEVIKYTNVEGQNEEWFNVGGAETPDTSNEKTPTWNDTIGGVTYEFYEDDGTLLVSGEGVCASNQFSHKNHSGEIKNIVFDKNAKISSIGNMWFAQYASGSQLESVEINSTVPLSIGNQAIYYRQGGTVNFTINAPSVTLSGTPVNNYGSPVNVIFNVEEPMTLAKGQLSEVSSSSTWDLTIPENSTCNTPASYEFKDRDLQDEYDHELGMAGSDKYFWREHTGLVEGTDYTKIDASTVTLTEENAADLLFGGANYNNNKTVKFASSDSRTDLAGAVVTPNFEDYTVGVTLSDGDKTVTIPEEEYSVKYYKLTNIGSILLESETTEFPTEVGKYKAYVKAADTSENFKGEVWSDAFEITDTRTDLENAAVGVDLEKKKVSVTVNDGNGGAITVDPEEYSVVYAPAKVSEPKVINYNVATDGRTINKDGVTCDQAFDPANNIESAGSFKTSKGKFTKIVINAMDFRYINGRETELYDWNIYGDTAIWEGSSDTVGFNRIYGHTENVSIEFTVQDNTADLENASEAFPTKPGVYWAYAKANETSENYKGEKLSDKFEIVDPRTSLENAVVTYNKYTDTATVTLNDEVISPEEYTVEYWNLPVPTTIRPDEPIKVDAITPENPGTYKVVAVAKEDSEVYRGTASSESFEIEGVRDLNDATVKVNKKALTVSFGEEVVPESEYSVYYVDILDPNGRLEELPVHPGKYTAVITANEDSKFFKGEKTYLFPIKKQDLEDAEVVTSVVEKSVKVTIDGDEVPADEYTVQYAPKTPDTYEYNDVKIRTDEDLRNLSNSTTGVNGVSCTNGFDEFNNIPYGKFVTNAGQFTKIVVHTGTYGDLSSITDNPYYDATSWTVEQSDQGWIATWTGLKPDVAFGTIKATTTENAAIGRTGAIAIDFTVRTGEEGEADFTQITDEFPAKAGNYVAIATAKEDSELFSGVGMGDFVVEKKSLENAEVSVDTEKKEVKVTLDGEVVPSSEYDVEFREDLGDKYNETFSFPEDAGNYTAKVTAKDKSNYYTGTATKDFIIDQKDITDADVEVLTETKEVVVSLGDTVVPKEDYTVLYAPKPADGEVGLPQAVEEFPTQPGEYTAYVTANSRNFIGSATADFVVEKFDLADATIIPDIENNRVSVKYGDDIVMSNEYDVKIVPKGYVEEEEAEDETALKDIADKVLLAIDELPGIVTQEVEEPAEPGESIGAPEGIGDAGTGEAGTPGESAEASEEPEDAATPGEGTEASEEIEEASEFKSVEFPTKPGEYTIIVTAKETSDTYQGVGTEDFTIEPKNLTNATVTVDTKKKTVTVKIGEEEVPADEYFVTLLDAATKEKLDQFPTAPGEYIASVNAEPDSEYFIGGKNEKFTIAKIDIAKAAVTVDTTKKTVTVKLSKTVIPATDYTLTFTQDGIDGETTEFPTEPGDYHVLVKMNDDCRTYTGTAGNDFTVADPAVDVVEKIQALKEYISDTEEIDGEKLGKDVEEIGAAYEALNEAAKSRVTNYDDFKLETACYAMYLAQANAEALKDAAVEAQKAAEKTAADALAAQKAAEEAQAAAEKAQKTAESKQAAAEKAKTAAEAEAVQAQADKAAAEAAQAAAETIAAEANKALEQAKADAATALEAQKAAEKTAADALAAQKTAEAAQATAEKAQKTAESKQAAAEKAKTAALAAQKAAENTATDALAAQKAAEEAQAAAEKAQAEAEAAAEQAKADKAAAEEAQAEAEKTAKQAEADKTAAEAAQAAAEKAQKTAESKQAAAEKAQTAAEAAQKAAEADKATAELAQADAETLAAEAQAAQAEAEEVAEAAQKALTAAQKAQTAAQKAQAAAEAAKTEAEAKQAEAEEAAKTAEAEAEQAIAEKTKAETDLEEAGKTIEDLKKQLEEALEKLKGDTPDTPDTPGTDEVLGDANSDKKLNIMDASFIAKKLSLKQGDELPTVADYNKDGKKNVLDALAIASYLANKKSGGAEKVTTPAETAEQSVVTDTTTTDVAVVTDNDIVAE